MSVKVDASGRRYMQMEFEVPGTPEEVWRAIATGPGMSSWFVPTVFEQKDGKAVAVKLTFGPGIEVSSAITKWNPPHAFATLADSFIPGSPPIANEWSVEARAGGKCVVRIVQSLFASTDDWDMQLESAKGGLSSFLEILRVYLTHFRGQSSTVMNWMVPAGASDAEAWASLSNALGVKAWTVGQRLTSDAGAPALGGVVEYLTQNPFDALVRIDKPGPGVAAFGATTYPGGPTMVGMNVYLYGDHGEKTADKEKPLWNAWFQKHFPMPAGDGA